VDQLEAERGFILHTADKSLAIRYESPIEVFFVCPLWKRLKKCRAQGAKCLSLLHRMCWLDAGQLESGNCGNNDWLVCFEADFRRIIPYHPSDMAIYRRYARWGIDMADFHRIIRTMVNGQRSISTGKRL